MNQRWDLIDDEVAERVRRVARKVAEKTFFEEEDLNSEGLILAATKADLIECLEVDELRGAFEHCLRQDLLNHVSTDMARRQRNVSYEVVAQSIEDEVITLPSSEADERDYTEDMVETLLPAVWDESYCYGLPDKLDAPDDDMPRSKGNPSQSNTIAAYIADIKTGWTETELTDKERRALLLRYGFGWMEREIAYNQGVTQQAISKRLKRGVEKITYRLNNGKYAYLFGCHSESEGAA